MLSNPNAYAMQGGNRAALQIRTTAVQKLIEAQTERDKQLRRSLKSIERLNVEFHLAIAKTLTPAIPQLIRTAEVIQPVAKSLLRAQGSWRIIAETSALLQDHQQRLQDVQMSLEAADSKSIRDLQRSLESVGSDIDMLRRGTPDTRATAIDFRCDSVSSSESSDGVDPEQESPREVETLISTEFVITTLILLAIKWAPYLSAEETAYFVAWLVELLIVWTENSL